MKPDIERIKKNKSMKELLQFSIINIDKSSGPTSFQVSEFVKRKLKGTKSSHFGTLDPKVTGVLPVAINRACKLAGYFLGEDKTYVGIMRMHEEIELDKIQEKINEKFLGEIIQMPPVKSRVKRELRPRTIYEFKVLEKDGTDVLFTASVQGGTYIRTLCVDLGEELGIGAHMLELRRVQAGIFSENDENYPSVSLYEFEKAVEEYNEGKEELLRKMIIPAEVIGTILPSIEVKEKAVDRILHGSPIHNDEVEDDKVLEKEEGEKFVAFSKGQFIGVFQVRKQKNEFAKAEFTLQPIK
jgi:H/ACA ribonucleoprotein complex subunit 4